jgi:hypothetical protein
MSLAISSFKIATATLLMAMAGTRLWEAQAHKPQAAQKAKPSAETSLGKLVASLNSLLMKDGLSVNTSGYHPFGFSFETLTGKLWWVRSLDSNNGGFCASPTLVFSAAPLSELDESSIKGIPDKNGTTTLELDCKGNPNEETSSCFERWVPASCDQAYTYLGPGNGKATFVVPGKYESEVEHFPRETSIGTAQSVDGSNSGSISLVRNEFRGRHYGLSLTTTGDPEALDKAISLLRQLVREASAKATMTSGATRAQGTYPKQKGSETKSAESVAKVSPEDTSLAEPLCPDGKMLLCGDTEVHVMNALVCVKQALYDSYRDDECGHFDDGTRLTKAAICNSTAYACGYRSGSGLDGSIVLRGKSYEMGAVHGGYQYFDDLTSIDSMSLLKSTILSWIKSKPPDQGGSFVDEYLLGKRDGSNARP